MPRGGWWTRYCGLPRESTAVDLRRYVARHNGVFPAYEWIAVVEHFDLESPHAGVWEQIRTAQAGTTGQGAAARGVVALIADYIISVQTK